RDGEVLLRTEDIESVIKEHGDSIALILLGGVNYYTGQVFDMERITQAGHAVGAVVGFDLAHAAGNIPLRLHDWGVDFACWCSYKYLNSGPGSVAGCFVHEKHAHNSDLPRFCGWWGHDKAIRFKMGPDFKAIPGAEGWQLSNPPILSLAAVKASLALFDEAGMDVLRAKSEKMTGYLEFLLQSLQSNKFAIMTPSDPAARGCQLSIVVHQGGRDVFKALEAAGVICDWREPDCIRVAPVPLYNSYNDVYRFVEIFAAQIGAAEKLQEAV
ncbi:MAG: kynureninase, partial [Alphaproteobacteria bacterium]|nr:kynureninase [Alphaproteobacteria bacterium]